MLPDHHAELSGEVLEAVECDCWDGLRHRMRLWLLCVAGGGVWLSGIVAAALFEGFAAIRLPDLWLDGSLSSFCQRLGERIP